MAREQCAWGYSGLRAPFVYNYQTRSGEVQYNWNGKKWVRGEPAYQTPVYASNANPPCGPSEAHPVIAEGYNLAVHADNDVNNVLPVCSNEEAPIFPSSKGGVDATTTLKFTEVLQILGCKRKEIKNIDLSDAKRSGQAGSDKAPKRVLLQDDDGNDVALGDENFQIRAILQGEVPSGLPERMMKLALWDQASPDNPLSALRSVGNYSVAEAEFFYDATHGRSEWMWNMNWRARLRRFRLPADDAMSRVEQFCNELPSSCGPLLDRARKLGTLIVH